MGILPHNHFLATRQEHIAVQRQDREKGKMGFFAHLYLVEATADDAGVEVVTSAFGRDLWPRTFFSWAPGQHATRLYEYAEGTLCADERLPLLPGFPVRWRCDPSAGGDENSGLIEASFTPQKTDDPVLFHFLLPRGFVPRRGLQPLVQPCVPYVRIFVDRVVATYPVIGPAHIQFWITRLSKGEALSDYDVKKFLHPDEHRGLRAEFEVNLGVFKIKLAR